MKEGMAFRMVDFCRMLHEGRGVSVFAETPRPSLVAQITISIATNTSSGPCVRKKNKLLTNTAA